MIMRLRATLKERARSSSSHYRDIQDGLFTKPVSLGKKSVGWPVDEINILNAAHITGLSEGEIQQLVEDLHAKRKTALSRAIEASSFQPVNEGATKC